MTKFTERVKAYDFLPLDKVIVVGSGVLDVFGLREADDVDLLSSTEAFTALKGKTCLTCKVDSNRKVEFLEGEGVEIWSDWCKVDGQLWDYDYLNQFTVVIDGVKFAASEKVLRWKQVMGRSKDERDIELLEEYLHGQAN